MFVYSLVAFTFSYLVKPNNFYFENKNKNKQQHVHWMSQLTVDTFQEIYPQPQHSSSSFVVDMQQLAHLISFRIICKYICGVDISTVTTKEYEKQAIKDVCFGNTVSLFVCLFVCLFFSNKTKRRFFLNSKQRSIANHVINFFIPFYVFPRY